MVREVVGAGEGWKDPVPMLYRAVQTGRWPLRLAGTPASCSGRWLVWHADSYGCPLDPLLVTTQPVGRHGRLSILRVLSIRQAINVADHLIEPLMHLLLELIEPLIMLVQAIRNGGKTLIDPRELLGDRHKAVVYLGAEGRQLLICFI